MQNFEAVVSFSCGMKGSFVYKVPLVVVVPWLGVSRALVALHLLPAICKADGFLLRLGSSSSSAPSSYLPPSARRKRQLTRLQALACHRAEVQSQP